MESPERSQNAAAQKFLQDPAVPGRAVLHPNHEFLDI